MERRDFLKLSAIGGATAALEGCGNPDHQLIRFIPEEDLIPGLDAWKPSICTLCPAGCGLLVRVMQGEAEVMRKGQLGILKMGLAKKLEGNPAHPINQGRLCPRGQAGLQVTYHPDRIKTPLVRTGARGSGQFKEITWDEALKQLVSQLSTLQANKQENGLAFVTSPLRGQRKAVFQGFTSAFKDSLPVEFAFFDDGVIRAANGNSFNHTAPATIDLSQSNYVISFGADFLGTWNSPVAQSIGFGHMRQGRSGQRGKFVQVESRISQTGASADEWIACPPGTEGMFALSLANVILREKLRPVTSVGHPGDLIDGWSQGLPSYAPEKISAHVGVPAEKIVRIAREAAASGPAVALIGDAPIAHTNGLFNALAVNALNALLGVVGKPGGTLFSSVWELPAPWKPAPPIYPHSDRVIMTTPADAVRPYSLQIRSFADKAFSDTDPVRVLLLNNANPVFGTPPSFRVREALGKVPFIASFGSFIDETSIFADLILPDSSPLESWLDDAPQSGSARTVVSLAPPAMHPLHDTRSMPDVLLDVAQQLGGDLTKALPWKTYDEALKATFATLHKEKGSQTTKDPDEFWSNAQKQGGWWSPDESAAVAPVAGKAYGPPSKNSEPEFDGKAEEFPFHFLPFASQMYYDGSLAHLPWMQEAPDPLSTVMWGSWVEINPRTAEKLAIKQGDLVEVASQHGTLRAPALVTPGIAPDVVAMPVGQGHENFTRYASGRGANPISILAQSKNTEIGSLAWAATRVKISAVGRANMILFGGSMDEESPETKHR